jgi:16S rRNA (guanine527-N7)-methyltransferase
VSRPVDVLAATARDILGRPITDREAGSFEKYLALLLKWQRVQRLVGSTDPDWIVRSLFLDSLLFLRVLPRTARSVADLGSGAGFPGIPIRIVRPDLAVTLIESRERRASFLSTVVRELGLEGTRIVSARAEELAGQIPGAFDAVLVRCAGNPEDVVPIAMRLVTAGGSVIVSAPPRVADVPGGPWLQVPGTAPGLTRGFGVFQKPVVPGS